MHALEFENNNRYKILLSHLPIAWLKMKNDALEEWNMDCVVFWSSSRRAGHFAWNPMAYSAGYGKALVSGTAEGCFDSKDGKRHLVLSAGLEIRRYYPQFNNIPEIVCVDLVPEGGW